MVGPLLARLSALPRRLVAGLLAGLAALPVPLAAQGTGQGTGAEGVTASLTIERPAPETLVQEAVILVIRVVVSRPVARLDVVAPQIPDVRSLTLVEGRWTANVDNLGAKGFERRIAIFPQRSGRLEIPPFAAVATLVDLDGRRAPVTVETEPQAIAVGEGPGARARWWLPARSVTITDRWEPSPDRLGPGEASRRTVVVEAHGVLAEQMPELPPLRTPGVVTFASPVALETRRRPDGPVARATYAWDVRLGVDEPVVLQALTLPWFDTAERRMREAVVPARRIGRVAEGPPSPAGAGLLAAIPPWLAALAAFAAGLGWTAARLGAAPPSLQGVRAWARERARLRALAGAARRGDAAAVRSALARLAREEGPRAAAAARGLRDLDRSLFGRGRAPDLRAVAREVARVRAGPAAPSAAGLAPLDGA